MSFLKDILVCYSLFTVGEKVNTCSYPISLLSPMDYIFGAVEECKTQASCCINKAVTDNKSLCVGSKED